jgi:hypothetical protein
MAGCDEFVFRRPPFGLGAFRGQEMPKTGGSAQKFARPGDFKTLCD